MRMVWDETVVFEPSSERLPVFYKGRKFGLVRASGTRNSLDKSLEVLNNGHVQFYPIGISSIRLPGSSSGRGASPGSRTGGSISGFGSPGGSSFGGSVGTSGVAGGFSGGSIGIYIATLRLLPISGREPVTAAAAIFT